MISKFILLAAFLLASCVQIERNNPDDPGSANYYAEGSNPVTITPGPSVTYEGETYQSIVIGTQTWFKRNLNYAVEGSKCYNNDKSYCDTYGRLYDWAAAMDLPENCNYYLSCTSQVSEKHRGVCPNGWHIPSDADWNVLMKSVNPSCSDNSNCTGAGTKLKSKNGWNNYDGSGITEGTDNYGFTALPAGGCYGDGVGACDGVPYEGNWWSAGETSWSMSWNIEYVRFSGTNKASKISVRCVKD